MSGYIIRIHNIPINAGTKAAVALWNGKHTMFDIDASGQRTPILNRKGQPIRISPSDKQPSVGPRLWNSILAVPIETWFQEPNLGTKQWVEFNDMYDWLDCDPEFVQGTASKEQIEQLRRIFDQCKTRYGSSLDQSFQRLSLEPSNNTSSVNQASRPATRSYANYLSTLASPFSLFSNRFSSNPAATTTTASTTVIPPQVPTQTELLYNEDDEQAQAEAMLQAAFLTEPTATPAAIQPTPRARAPDIDVSRVLRSQSRLAAAAPSPTTYPTISASSLDIPPEGYVEEEKVIPIDPLYEPIYPTIESSLPDQESKYNASQEQPLILQPLPLQDEIQPSPVDIYEPSAVVSLPPPQQQQQQQQPPPPQVVYMTRPSAPYYASDNREIVYNMDNTVTNDILCLTTLALVY